MKACGYENGGDNVLGIEEVTISLTPEELVDFVFFLEHVRVLMEQNSDEFGHEHFSDWIAERGNVRKEKPDIIIVRETRIDE